MCYCNREEMQYYKFPSKIITFRQPKARVLRNLSFCKVVLRLIYRLNILYMNVDGGLRPRGISIFSICIFWIEVLSNFGRYNENDHCRFFFQVIDVLSKLAGLWVNGRNEIMYSQASQITFICPMIFNYFPLDTQVNFSLQFGIFSHASMLQYKFHFYLHFSRNILFINTIILQVCKFQVGSYSYNMEKMIFHVSQLGYAHTSR